MKVVIYARISQDRPGTKSGVKRQLSECRTLAKQRGLIVIDEHVDNDISATSGKPRPEWDRVLARVKSGEIQGIVAWHTDRMYRRVKDLQTLLDLADRGLQIFTVKGGHLDLGDPTGRMLAGVVAQIATYEVEHKISRSLSKSAATAAVGGFHGGPIPMGYRRAGTGKIEKDPEAAAVLQDAARRLLAGETLTEVTRIVRVALGKPKLKPVSLKAALTRPTIVGKRQHVTVKERQKWNARRALGEVSGEIPEREASEADAQWEAILTMEEWQRLRHRLLSNPRRGAPQKHLLSGILICEICGGRLGFSNEAYKCNGVESNGCAGLAISRRAIERHISALMRAGLAPARAPIDIPVEPIDDGTLADLSSKRLAILRQFRLDRITEQELDIELSQLDRDIKRIQGENEAVRHRLIREQEALRVDTAKWDAATEHQRREMIQAFFPNGITIFKSPRGSSSGKNFNPGRVYLGPPPWENKRIPKPVRERYRQDRELRLQGITPEPWSSPEPIMTEQERAAHEAEFAEARRQLDQEMGWS